jgi:hypothetical protein
MTMPYGSTEEPDINIATVESVPVHVISSDAKPGKSIAPEFGRWRTFLVTNAVGQDIAVPGARRIAARSLRRHRLLIKVNGSGQTINTTPTVTAVPAIATSGTAVQNPNGVPVNVTLAGFTATQVFVNGILVGASNGTYIVPAYGSISVTFTVVGATTTAAIPSTGPQAFTDGVIVGGREEIAALLPGGNQAALNPLTTYTPGGYLQIGDNVRWESQQELWVAYPSSNTAPVVLTVCDEQYASDSGAWKEHR